jgi:hypothetical protein
LKSLYFWFPDKPESKDKLHVSRQYPRPIYFPRT